LTRSIPPSLGPVLAELELAGADLVTSAQLGEILRAAGVRTETHIVAARLRELGWLLPTGQRGVWEFAPAAVAGPYSRGGHTRLLRSVLARAEVACGLTFQAAAWANGLADRAPSRVEVAAATERDARRLPRELDVSVFAPRLGYITAKGVPTLRPASVLTHMATSPSHVRSWTSALEWLPDVAAEAPAADVLAELQDRHATVAAARHTSDRGPALWSGFRTWPPRRQPPMSLLNYRTDMPQWPPAWVTCYKDFGPTSRDRSPARRPRHGSDRAAA